MKIGCNEIELNGARQWMSAAGDRDRITDLDRVQPWFDALAAPAKRLEVVEGVGHLGLFEAPARFVDFMDGVRASLESA